MTFLGDKEKLVFKHDLRLQGHYFCISCWLAKLTTQLTMMLGAGLWHGGYWGTRNLGDKIICDYYTHGKIYRSLPHVKSNE